MKAARRAGSLIPTVDSTPLETSTPQGRATRIASTTFPACNPPARINGCARSRGINDQSNVLPLPPASPSPWPSSTRSEEHTSELQSRRDLVCRLLLEKKKKTTKTDT